MNVGKCKREMGRMTELSYYEWSISGSGYQGIEIINCCGNQSQTAGEYVTVTVSAH